MPSTHPVKDVIEEKMEIIKGIYISDEILENTDEVDRHIFDSLKESEMEAETAKKLLKGYIDLFLRSESDDYTVKRKTALYKLVNLKKKRYTKADYLNAKKAMDESHEGLEYLKKALLEEVANAVISSRTPRPLLLVGSPGSGKTSLTISLAKGLGKGYEVISLSGVSGTFTLKGNDQGWKGATYGKIIDAFIRSETLSPVIIFDELDKIGKDDRYGKAVDSFLDLLEDDRKTEFTDDFLTLPFDCSNAWTVFTANTLEGIPEPILDRLRIVEMKRYTLDELEKISEKIIRGMNSEISPRKLIFEPKALKMLVLKKGALNYSVRPIREAIEKIFSSKAQAFMENMRIKTQKVCVEDIESCLQIPSLNIVDEYGDEYSPGIINAIAVNMLSGYLAPIEVTQSSDDMISVYGSCDSTMKENAFIAFDMLSSFIREKENKRLPFVNMNYITSIPKSGNSAGLATALAILGEYKKIKVSKKIAVTGAITLKGAVLPVGMITAKLYGASKDGADCIIIPEKNRKEVESIPSELIGNMKIEYVATFEDAVRVVFPTIKYTKTVLR